MPWIPANPWRNVNSHSSSHPEDTSAKVKYDPKQHDPQANVIDGSGRCYPNCDSTVWLRSCEKEITEPLEGHVIGTIPVWLNGSLLRNGPGSWKVGDMTFQHLFDCSALLHRFAIHNGSVTYQNRFVQTETLKKNNAAQRIVVTEFGTAAVPDPCHSIFDRVSAMFRPESASDNSMISIYPIGDELYTFAETPFVHRINPRTLATEARICVSDYTGVIHHTSHPHVLSNGTVYNLGLGSTKSGPVYQIICFPHGEDMFENAYVKAQIPCRWKLNPGYMHTFGLTENYFVIVEQPLSVSLSEYIKTQVFNQNMSACLKWFDDKPCYFYLVHRQTGELAHKFQSNTFFYMHIINQYEQDDHVVIDICCYKNPEMINSMYLESIMNMQSNPNYAAEFRGRPLRFVLPLSNSSKQTTLQNENGYLGRRQRLMKSMTLSAISARLQQPKLKRSQSDYEDVTFIENNTNATTDDFNFTAKNDKYKPFANLVTLGNTKAEAYQLGGGPIFVHPELLCDLGCETPRINYDRYLAKPYQYFYAISSDVDADNPGTLIKVDVINKTCLTWCEENCFPSEPIFVPSPNAIEEDDGVVLASMIWGGLNENKVGLLVLCAKTMNELGRCMFHTNGPVPKCLHGWYAKDLL
uniref:Carotenoid isomerooxygenase n=1 Tax=Stomoxys calcitrans TaxID=35570 RepID=A0A1I8QDQ2_STOCA